MVHCRDLKNKVKDLVRNCYLNEYVNILFPLADEQKLLEKVSNEDVTREESMLELL